MHSEPGLTQVWSSVHCTAIVPRCSGPRSDARRFEGRLSARVVVASSVSLLLALGGCTPGSGKQTSPSAAASSSAHPSAVLPSATDADDVRSDQALTASLDAEFASEDYADLRSMIVMAEGRTVYERYFRTEPENRQHVWSVTKSVVSTLVGIAIGEGLIKGVDATLGELLPNQAEAMTPEVAGTTLDQLLSMSGGFTDELHGDGVENFVPRILDRQVWHRGQFHYADASAHLVAAIVAEASGMTVLEYARSRLFDPLGIESSPVEELPLDAFDLDGPGFGWAVDGEGIHAGGLGLRLRAQDMAKIGLLYLQDGMWQERQIVPAEWVKTATRQHIKADEGTGYGYFWWTSLVDSEPVYLAAGHGGQRIIVMPSHDLVAVWQIWVDPATGAEQPVATKVGEVYDETIAPAFD